MGVDYFFALGITVLQCVTIICLVYVFAGLLAGVIEVIRGLTERGGG